ncbi:MFS transporter [Nocardioides panacisoli]|uniref:MFS transporter n=1 Tax=Nocardioides panacisoli TaxID=627624 RepID=UPI001C634050|nr:MFS transporter [Nocardioides panacisoli]QYJ02740.1 MFS transporter [Nocardioides panacisoli]
MTDVRRPARTLPWTALVLGLGIVMLASSLRAGVTSIGVLLPELREGLGMDATTVSLLTSLPVWCFAVVGLGAGAVIMRLGVHRVTVLLLTAIVVGLLARAVTDSAWGFLLATTVAMFGAALGNVVLPPLTRQHFPNRVPLVSALYGGTLLTGAAVAAGTSAPIADAFDSWRVALATWSLLALVGLAVWLPTAIAERPPRHERRAARTRATISLARVARTRVAWALALLFGAQSSQAYAQFGYWSDIFSDAGVDATRAGAILGVTIAVGIPITLSLPVLMRYAGTSVAVPISFAAITAAGWLGVATAPLFLGGWLWGLLLGTGGSAFTWCLALIGLRARTPQGSAQLSSFAQGTGYLLAATATFSVGLLHDATDTWGVPIGMLIVLTGVMAVAGSVAIRSAPIEEELAAQADQDVSGSSVRR